MPKMSSFRPAIVLLRGVFAFVLLPCLLTGCSIKVDKSGDGEDKNVTIHTPLGGVHVQKNATTAQDIGLPSYPGASVLSDQDGGHSADVHLGFGDWQLNVRAAKYQTTDPEAKVTAFYKSAMSRYGSVVECRNDTPVGTPTMTGEGLGCDDKHRNPKGFHLSSDEGDHDLRAGSKRHQHIVGMKPGASGGTVFTLLQVDLPAAFENSDHSKEE